MISRSPFAGDTLVVLAITGKMSKAPQATNKQPEEEEEFDDWSVKVSPLSNTADARERDKRIFSTGCRGKHPLQRMAPEQCTDSHRGTTQNERLLL